MTRICQICEGPLVTCTCDGAGVGLRQCPTHFRIYRDGVRLTSIGRIIKACYPQPERMPPPDVLENARLRGIAVESLLNAYIAGTLSVYPVGTRKDAIPLFEKAADWFDKQNFKRVECQVVLGDNDHGGVLDYRCDGMTLDLKSTYSVMDTARLQVAGYANLGPTNGVGILHVTERIAEAKLVPVTLDDCADWRTMLASWRMLTRRKAFGRKENADE